MFIYNIYNICFLQRFTNLCLCMDKYLYVYLRKLHEHVCVHVDGDSVTYTALVALNLRPD